MFHMKQNISVGKQNVSCETISEVLNMDEMQRDFYTKTEVNNKFGGMILLKISKADFDELETKDPDTIYYVYDESGKVTQYVGDSPMSASANFIVGDAILYGLSGTFGAGGITGTAELIEEV